MGYCPFSVLDRDTAGGVATRTAWPIHDRRVCAHSRAVAHATAPVRAHDTGAERAIWFFLGPRSRHQFFCCNMAGVGTRLAFGRDIFSCRGKGNRGGVATWVSLFCVATRNWCRYRLGPIGVATHFFVSRHGLACLGSRLDVGVTTKLGHGRGSWCHDMGLVSRQGQVVDGVTTHARPARSGTTPNARRQRPACW